MLLGSVEEKAAKVRMVGDPGNIECFELQLQEIDGKKITIGMI